MNERMKEGRKEGRKDGRNERTNERTNERKTFRCGHDAIFKCKMIRINWQEQFAKD